MKKKAFSLLAFSLAAALALAGQEGKAALLSNDLSGLDNSLELSLDEEGRIVFILASYYPSPGYMEQYSLDVVRKRAELHDRGVATDEEIVREGPSAFAVKSASRHPLSVSIEGGKVRLDIGAETFLVSKPGDYLVEAGPRGKDGQIAAGARNVYSIASGGENGFLGFKQHGWFPGRQYAIRDIDSVAEDSPEDMSFDGKSLKAVTFRYGAEREAVSMYTYALPRSGSREVNLMNYLVLLTQRRDEGDPSYPVIHPVLLTLYFFDALVAR